MANIEKRGNGGGEYININYMATITDLTRRGPTNPISPITTVWGVIYLLIN